VRVCVRVRLLARPGAFAGSVVWVQRGRDGDPGCQHADGCPPLLCDGPRGSASHHPTPGRAGVLRGCPAGVRRQAHRAAKASSHKQASTAAVEASLEARGLDDSALAKCLPGACLWEQARSAGPSVPRHTLSTTPPPGHLRSPPPQPARLSASATTPTAAARIEHACDRAGRTPSRVRQGAAACMCIDGSALARVPAHGARPDWPGEIPISH
jgi:hypothetical protein